MYVYDVYVSAAECILYVHSCTEHRVAGSALH